MCVYAVMWARDRYNFACSNPHHHPQTPTHTYRMQKQLERAMDGPIDVIHVKQVCPVLSLFLDNLHYWYVPGMYFQQQEDFKFLSHFGGKFIIHQVNDSYVGVVRWSCDNMYRLVYIQCSTICITLEALDKCGFVP